MKKYAVFYLIIFIFFVLQSFSVEARCSVPQYDGICCQQYTGIYIWPSGRGWCAGGLPFFGTYSEEVAAEMEAPEEVVREVITPSAEFSTTYLTLAFQFFGMVVLFILLVTMVEELVKNL